MGSNDYFEAAGGGWPGKTDASLNEKLSHVEWGEYRLGCLFDIEHTSSFNTDRLVPGNDYDYVTRTSLNQGILQTTGFVNQENLNPSGVWSLGLLQMDFFYRQRPWYAGQFVRKVVPKFVPNEKTALFFSTLLNKQKPKLLSVLVRDVDEAFRHLTVRLPVTKTGEIDFAFMESFISALEARRTAKLRAYLTAAGLVHSTLTATEESALQQFPHLPWAPFNLQALFGPATRGKRLKSADRIEGELPFVTAGEAEEGVSAYIGNPVEVFSGNTTTIDMFGSAKYRNYDYGADDHIAVVHTEHLPKFAALFVTAAIHKASHTGKFDYSMNFYAKDADALSILLPVKGGQPDYQTMACVVSAIQKLVIEDVVLYVSQKENL